MVEGGGVGAIVAALRSGGSQLQESAAHERRLDLSEELKNFQHNGATLNLDEK